jgi:hypothetical protein
MPELSTVPGRAPEPSSSEHRPLATDLWLERIPNRSTLLRSGNTWSAGQSPAPAVRSILRAIIVLPLLVAALSLLALGLVPALFIALTVLFVGAAPVLLVIFGILLIEGVEFTRGDSPCGHRQKPSRGMRPRYTH